MEKINRGDLVEELKTNFFGCHEPFKISNQQIIIDQRCSLYGNL